MQNINEIPSDHISDSARELIREIVSLENRLSSLRQLECTSPFFEFEYQEVQAELSDLREDLELELAIERAVPRFRKKAKKLPPRTQTPANAA